MIASSGHGWVLALFPLLAGAISLVFATLLAARFLRRRRMAEGLWAIAMFMYAIASFAMFAGVVAGWTPARFRVYWLFGAVLNVPFLAQGELYLLFRRRLWADLCLALLFVGTAFAAWKVLQAPVHAAALTSSLPLGKDAFGDNSAPYRLSQLYSFPAYFLLLGGLLWSVLAMRGRRELRARAGGVAAIAVGATIVAIGSGIGAGFHLVAIFALGLVLGVAVMFWGFVTSTRPSVVSTPSD